MISVRFMRTALELSGALYNCGETASFEDGEAAHLIGSGIAERLLVIKPEPLGTIVKPEEPAAHKPASALSALRGKVTK